MYSNFLASHAPISQENVTEKDLELTDTAILLQYYQPNEMHPASYEIGQGTPRGAPFSLRPRLVPVPRWLAPKPMSAFDAPQRRPCVALRDPRKARNFRVSCWMHTESKNLAKSPLNDTGRRAFMPARTEIPLKGSMFCIQRPRPSGPNALRAFGTILPGSTLKAYQLSKPSLRDVNGHILGASKQAKNTPIPIPTPPPRITRKSVLRPSPDGARVMVHRMNLARQQWNTNSIRAHRLCLYTQLASESVSSKAAKSILPAVRCTIHNIDGICAYAKKMAAIEGSEARHKEAETLAELRDYFHKLLRGEATPTVEHGGPLLQGLNHLHEDPVVAKTTGEADNLSYSGTTPELNAKITSRSVTQKPTARAYHYQSSTSNCISASVSSISSRQPTSHASTHAAPTTEISHIALNGLRSIIWSAQEVSSVERRQSPIAPDPKPSQKRSRAPADSVASTRVLRSMSKTKEVVVRVVAPSTARRQPCKQSKAKQAPSTSAHTFTSIPEDSTTTTRRYNLRPRKREYDEGGTSVQGNKRTSRPTKRRRA
ncbi:hypothetical protein OPQ81_010125 [Rhizoctonia solani]|nr:hypothetical protein OPQ81_010125 [Rhizoctonia solani]